MEPLSVTEPLSAPELPSVAGLVEPLLSSLVVLYVPVEAHRGGRSSRPGHYELMREFRVLEPAFG